MEDKSHLINQLYRDISGLNNEISNNNEKLARLKSAHQEITSSQEEFMMNKKYVNQPEFTSSTWMGKHANEFIQIRQEIEHSYSKVGNNDIEEMLNSIENKITYYENANRSLSSTISSKRDRISQLND
jgi:chromosome segregation ATPase